jgi:hypothetical protein
MSFSKWLKLIAPSTAMAVPAAGTARGAAGWDRAMGIGLSATLWLKTKWLRAAHILMRATRLRFQQRWCGAQSCLHCGAARLFDR